MKNLNEISFNLEEGIECTVAEVIASFEVLLESEYQEGVRKEEYKPRHILRKEDLNVLIKVLERELYKYPPTSMEFDHIQTKLRQVFAHLGGKYDKFLICMQSAVGMRHQALTFIRKTFQSNGAFPNTDEMGHAYLFSNHSSFVENPYVKFVQRRDAEYNIDYKQFVVCCYITDGKHLALLHTGSNGQTRIEDRYTMIQGHVEFNEQAYLMSQYEFLRENMIAELNEEIHTDVNLVVPEEPKFFVNSAVKHIDLEHFGIVYEIRVPSIPDIIDRLKTGESGKHDIVMVELSDDEAFGKMDTWLQYVVEKLRKE